MASKFRFNFDLSSMQKNAQLKKDFEEFKKTDIGKESLEKLDLSPEAAYSEYTNRTKFIESASKLQAGNLKSQKANIFNKLLPELAETNGGIIPTGQMNGIVPTNQGGINIFAF